MCIRDRACHAVAQANPGRRRAGPTREMVETEKELCIGDSGGNVMVEAMRYLVKARVKPGKEHALRKAIEDGTLGRGSVAGDEYLWNMQQARLSCDGTAHWVEVCFCQSPLEEERPYWEEYFDLISVQ